jgi:cell division protein FtsL
MLMLTLMPMLMFILHCYEQVGKLEDEIRALKEKLLQQQQSAASDSADGSSGNNNSSANNSYEEKYKQQIADMESAMKVLILY